MPKSLEEFVTKQMEKLKKVKEKQGTLSPAYQTYFEALRYLQVDIEKGEVDRAFNVKTFQSHAQNITSFTSLSSKDRKELTALFDEAIKQIEDEKLPIFDKKKKKAEPPKPSAPEKATPPPRPTSATPFLVNPDPAPQKATPAKLATLPGMPPLKAPLRPQKPLPEMEQTESLKHVQLSKYYKEESKEKTPEAPKEEFGGTADVGLLAAVAEAMKFLPKQIEEYSAHDADNNIGIAELLGKRPNQEDTVISASMDESVAKLPPASIIQGLKDTVASVEQKVEQHEFAKTEGSCLLANLTIGTSVYTANVGDSTSFVVTLDEKGQFVGIEQLNTLHHEQLFDPLRGTLAVNRSIGDTDYHDSGLSHDADVTHKEIKIPPGGRAFVITACDGLTEAGCLTQKDIGEIVAKHRDKYVSEIAMILAKTAYEKGSGDNISVIVTEMDPNDKTPKLSVVADGHGVHKTADVSKFIKEEFPKSLDHQVDKCLKAQAKADALAQPKHIERRKAGMLFPEKMRTDHGQPVNLDKQSEIKGPGSSKV